MPSVFQAFFSPQAVAIIGASGRSDSLAARLDRNLRATTSGRRVHLVNPRYETLDGRPCYSTVTAIPETVDLACILVSADRVLEAIADCGKAGVPAAIIYSSGFRETGEAGRDVENSILEIARASGVRLLGPNCQGLVSFAAPQLLATFSNALALDQPDHGPIAYVGQSGAIGGAVLDKARERGIGMSVWASTGNQLDLDIIELASAALDRSDTTVVLLYLEGLASGQEFALLADKALELGKRIVMLHVGVSERGGDAVSSHTGAILPPSRVLRTFAREQGIDVASDVDELLDLAVAASSTHRVLGNRLAVVTSSGGGGIIAADQAEDVGLDIVTLPSHIQDRVSELVPAFGATSNPVDVTTALFSGEIAALGDDFAEVCRRVAQAENVDVVLIVLTMIVGERADRLAEALKSLADDTGKPIHIAWLTSLGANMPARSQLIRSGIPVYSTVSAAIASIAVDVHARPYYELARSTRSIGVLGSPAPPEPARTDPAADFALLDAWEVPQPPWKFVSMEDSGDLVDFGEAGEQSSYAVKGIGPRLQHKTEANAVFLNVANADVSRQCQTIADGPAGALGLDGFLIQEMAQSGVEMLVSVSRQPGGFPPLLAIGLGGVIAEVYADVVTVTLPTSSEHVRAAIGELQGAPLLGEFRGRPERDIDALIELVGALCQGFVSRPDIQEVELNPVMLYETAKGAVAVDALVI